MTLRIGAIALLLSLHCTLASAQGAERRDEFFWLGQTNKATAVINTDEGLLERSIAPRIAAGSEATLLHAGRSSQDMHATYRAAILREDLLKLATQLNKTSASIVNLAGKHTATIVPNYTNGVAAQPNSFGHYLLGQAAGFERDAQRIREAYARIDRSAMGTTVLNGSSCAAEPHAHGRLPGLRGRGRQRLRRLADLVGGAPGGGRRRRDLDRAAHRQLHRGPDDAVRAVAALDPAAGRRQQHLRLQRHAAKAASQELADVLMRKYKLPFRVGHHFASEVVDHAKANNIKPLEFPYAEARRIYRDAVKNDGGGELPMSEQEFRATLDPVAIVKNRATAGGPQPPEMDRMLRLAQQKLAEQDGWIAARRARIDSSLARLDADFDQLLKTAN